MPTLVYFDLGARAEPMRMLLHHAKVQYEDKRVTGESWQEFKHSDKCPTGQIPVYIDDEGRAFNQTVSILRYLGGQHGYIPDDLMARYYCDNAIDAVYGDLYSKEFNFRFFKDELAEEDIKDNVARFVKLHANLEKLLAAHGGKYMAGDSLSIADFVVFGLHTCSALNATAKVAAHRDALNESVAQFPLFSKYRAHMQEVFAEYIATRKPSSF